MLWITLRQLKSKQAPARRQAAEALAQAPDPGAFDALAEALADEDAEVRRHAATAIGKLEHERRSDILLKALGDRDPEVLKAVLAALKHSKDERLAPALIPLLRHTDPGVRGYAAALLNSRGWRPEERTEEINFHIARGQLAKAASHGAPAIQALESVIQTGSYTQRVAAVEALGKIDDQRVLKPLLAALRSADPSVCAAAATALGQRGDPQVCDSLLPMLRHADGHVRTMTVEALARTGGARVVDALKPMLRDPVWDVRRAAAAALGKLKDARAVEELTGTLRDDDADVREATAIALGGLSDRRAIGPLVKALADSTSGVRRIAAAALSRIDEDWSTSSEAQTAVEDLKGVLQDKDSDLRYTVGKLLHSLGVHTPETEVLLPGDTPSSSPEKRRKLAVSLLLATLCDGDRILRQAAAESLGHLGESRAEPALQRALRDADAGVRRAAEQALLALQETGKAT
jgi:HEAT repeat protein